MDTQSVQSKTTAQNFLGVLQLYGVTGLYHDFSSKYLLEFEIFAIFILSSTILIT